MEHSEIYRIQSDTLGKVRIKESDNWGVQTQRSMEHFQAGDKIPLSIIKVLLIIKKYAAETNFVEAKLSYKKKEAIVSVVDYLLSQKNDKLRENFPLVVFQTGSGTQTNMNVNEVISHLSLLKYSRYLEPNDDVNMGQSSNDVFSTAMNISACIEVNKLTKIVGELIEKLRLKQDEYWNLIKIGRTHFRDAVPMTFGQEISGWIAALKHDIEYINSVSTSLHELPIGGTAVGTGINTTKKFGEKLSNKLASYYNFPFTTNCNKFYGLAHHSAINIVHSAINVLAMDLLKISNDIRLLSSGPLIGSSEIVLPANEQGSSIMPGKVNPTQIEALTMVCIKVLGNDVVISTACSQGNLELNTCKPLIIYSFLESTDLLWKTLDSFTKYLISGMKVNKKKIDENVKNSTMVVTALSPIIGYKAVSEIIKKSEKENITLREAAIRSGIDGYNYDLHTDPQLLCNISYSKKE